MVVGRQGGIPDGEHCVADVAINHAIAIMHGFGERGEKAVENVGIGDWIIKVAIRDDIEAAKSCHQGSHFTHLTLFGDQFGAMSDF